MPRRGPPLADYQTKRDFARTAEPSGIGDSRIRPSPHLRFVVQKHDATRLHYDLRLEVGDVFKSWAVTRGPSLDPENRRLAVAVEDHPLDYGDFEGTVPEGEYGGGTVMIWDRGFWEPETEMPAHQSLHNGELKFILAGDKLRGSFVLVRLKRRAGESGDNWLLIKHRDQWAAGGTDVLAQDRSVASGRTMEAIAARRGKAPTRFMTWGGELEASARWDHTATTRSKRGLAARRAAAGPSLQIAFPRLTNPDRALWPSVPPITKRELAEYLMAVAPRLMSQIHGRPCSLVRAPDGIDGAHFFQRHALPGQPATLTTVKLDRDREPYLEIDDAGTLVAMAQFSVCEFHPWNCAPFQPLVPGRLVFDLDPAPDVLFEDVVYAAKELRARLARLGLIAFCKTTGGKGLHVVVPLTSDDSTTWDQAKLFSQTVANQLARDAPDRFVVTMSKAKRSGRIFIDYLRNDLAATAVAAFSPRARTGAPVSMPLKWRQVQRGLDPMRFTIRTVPSMLPRSNAWNDYDAGARSLREAIRALVGAAS